MNKETMKKNGIHASKRVKIKRAAGIEGKALRGEAYKAVNGNGYIYRIANKTLKREIRERLVNSGAMNDFIINTTDDDVEYFKEKEYFEIEYETTKKDLMVKLMKYDIISLLFNTGAKWGEYNECKLIPGNLCWISSDGKTKIHRYFSLNRETKEVYGFNIWDLMEIISGFDMHYAMRILVKTLKIKYKEGEWMKIQEYKYLHNLSVIMKPEKIAGDFPELYKYVKSYLPVLEKLNNIAQLHIYGEDYSVHDDAVFFSSLNYISNYHAEIYKTDRIKVNRAINLFALLGMVEKVDPAKVPQEVLDSAINLTGEFIKFNLVNIYTIPVYDYMTLKKANEVVKKLRENKVVVKYLTREVVADIFGEEKAREIYGE